MVAWSRLVSVATPRILRCAVKIPHQAPQHGQVRLASDHRVFNIQPTQWQWQKLLDWMHFYILLGAIPLLLVVTYVNTFIGPATLEPIPEGYTPKHWEYYRHPIQRFLSRYMYTPLQQDYEKSLFRAYKISQQVELRKLERKINYLQQTNSDYVGVYFRPFDAARFIYFAREHPRRN